MTGPALERLHTHVAEVGAGLRVRRALPTRARRRVGAWVFFDHIGPAEFAPGQGLNIGPHPHIGLQTFTWMIEGELLHRDSLGFEQRIRPGQVNLMTAGRGIAHAEESVAPERGGRVHATQLWIALPDHERQRAPGFRHHPELPHGEQGGFELTLLAGEAIGARSPVEVFSPLLGLDLKASGAASTQIEVSPDFEHAVLCLNGAVEVEGERIEPGMLLYLGTQRDSIALRTENAAQALLIGGEPMNEDILVWWNFVARTPEEIARAAQDWNAGRHFGEVAGTKLARIPSPDPTALHLHAG